MVESLDEAQDNSLDPLTATPPSLSNLHYTGRPGRPRIEIDPGILSRTLPIEPKTAVAGLLGCSARTVRRRQQEVEHQTGVLLAPRQSALSEDELDAIVSQILNDFPYYGRSMVMGAMTVRGHNVPERRIRESIDRVRGVPGRFFGSRPIHRRKYYVPAANSLWHHDGQHGALYNPRLQGGNSTPPRIDPLEDRHPWLHRREDTIRCWPQSTRQQQSADRVGFLLEHHFRPWLSQSGPR